MTTVFVVFDSQCFFAGLRGNEGALHSKKNRRLPVVRQDGGFITNEYKSGLPDSGAVFAHHFAVARQVEGLLEFRHVRERSVATEVPG